MGLKIFLDVNVIIDYSLKRSIGYKQSKEILEKVINGEYEAYTSSIVVHIVGHMLKKDLKTSMTRKIILSLLNDILIINPPREILIQAMSSGWNDLEDAIQYYTALYHEIDVLISRDKSFMKKALPTLPVISPDDFLASF